MLWRRKAGADDGVNALVGFCRSPVLSALCCLLVLFPGCGAVDKEAPPVEPVTYSCATLDQHLEHAIQLLHDGRLPGLQVVVDELTSAEGDRRVRDAVRLIVALLQRLPEEELAQLDLEATHNLLERLSVALIPYIHYLAAGTPEVDSAFAVLRLILTDCGERVMLEPIHDLLTFPQLAQSLSQLLRDPLIVDVLFSIDGLDRGGFIEVMRLVFAALTKDYYNFGDIRGPIEELLAFTSMDLTVFLETLDEYLQGERLVHLRALVECIMEIEVDGVAGTDIIGGLLFDFLTIDPNALPSLLDLLLELLDESRYPGLESLVTYLISELRNDADLRRIAKELIVFLLDPELIFGLLDSVEVMLAEGILVELFGVLEDYLRCGEL